MSQALLYFINYVFTAYVYVLLIRFFLQKMGTSWQNPVTRFAVVLTEKPLKPLRYLFPGIKGFDLSIIVLAFLVELAESGCLVAFNLQIYVGWLSLIVIAFGELLQNLVNLFFFTTILSAILSWFPQMQSSPVASVINQLASPLKRLVGRWLPPMGGFDFSPIVVIFLLILIERVVVNPLILFGIRL